MDTKINIDIRSMSFPNLLGFLDSLAGKVIIPTRLRHVILSNANQFPFSTVGEYLNAGDRASELLMRIPSLGRKTENDLRIVVQDAMGAAAMGSSIAEYNQVQELPLTFSQSQLEMPIAKLAFPEIFRKLIQKISVVSRDIITVNDLINLDSVTFTQIPTVGKLYALNLKRLQNELPQILEAQAKKFKSFSTIKFSDIDNDMIDDIEGYLWTLDEFKMDIALSRWGFNHEHETLEEVARRYKVTRERIRQIEKPINTALLMHLSIPSKILWANIRAQMTEDLTLLLPNLAKCFATDKLFYGFIELCCQVEKGSISNIIFTKFSSEVTKSIFTSNPSPISQETIINELMSSYGYDKASVFYGIKNLVKLNKIEITEQGMFPKNLGKKEAVAHALTSYSAGLPWKDVVRIINKHGYSSTPFNSQRQIPSAFTESDYVYLCGLGTYRHLRFFDIEQCNISEIMQKLIEYFKYKQTTAIHLHDYYQQTENHCGGIAYFNLRHIVRDYGEEYGLHFNGQSGSDSISLDHDSKRITQADVIIKLLNDSKVALTNQEIAERLRSKSTKHASFMLNKLRDEGKVVRVDKMVYTTPEKAFSNIDTQSVMHVIREILSFNDHLIVEADIFREYVNMELNLSYSKYIYAALVNTKLQDLGWYQRNMLFSKKPISYKNLLDICKQLCDTNMTNEENIKIINLQVWLSDAVAASAIHQWRLHLTTQAELPSVL